MESSTETTYHFIYSKGPGHSVTYKVKESELSDVQKQLVIGESIREWEKMPGFAREAIVDNEVKKRGPKIEVMTSAVLRLKGVLPYFPKIHRRDDWYSTIVRIEKDGVYYITSLSWKGDLATLVERCYNTMHMYEFLPEEEGIRWARDNDQTPEAERLQSLFNKV